jgi:hypothetical protein
VADYKELKNRAGTLHAYVRMADGAVVPLAQGNKDYKEFLDLQAKGQVTILPADPVVLEDPAITAARAIFTSSTQSPGARLDALVILLNLRAPTANVAAPPVAKG